MAMLPDTVRGRPIVMHDRRYEAAAPSTFYDHFDKNPSAKRP